MEPSIRIRLMTAEDVPKLAAIDAGSNPSPWTEGMFRKELELPQSVCLVAEMDGIAVGFGAAWIVSECLQVLQVAVQEEFRRKGIGKALLRELETEGRKKGCGKSELECRDDNASALALYEKSGYSVAGERKKFYGDADAVLMERTL